MASSTNINGFNIGGNNNSFDQRGHFYRAFLSGNVSGMLVKQNSTPNMTVLVEHGSALLNKNTISASIAEIKSDVSVAIDTANTANPRIDSVVIYEDTSVAIPTVEANYWQDGAGGRFKIVSLPGTAAASPTALTDANIQSAIGAGKPFARLANITVPANSTTILNSNINNSVRSTLSASIANSSVTLPKIYGGTTAGVLTTDANGNVSAESKDFTTAEVNTGAKWIDGKTIYRISYSWAVTGSGGEQGYTHATISYANMGNIIRTEGGLKTNAANYEYYPIQYANPSAPTAQNFQFKFGYVGGILQIRYNAGTSGTANVAVYYTKP